MIGVERYEAVAISGRALALLVGLLGAVLLGAALVSLLPPEWQANPAESPLSVRVAAGANGGSTATGADAGSRLARVDDTLARDFGVFNTIRGSFGGFTVRLASLLTLLISGLAGLYLAPARVGRVAAALREPWSGRLRLLLLGLAAVVLAGALILLAGLTLFGPLAWLFVFAAMYLGALLGLLGVSLPLGRVIARRFGLAEQPPQVDLLIGLLALFFFSLPPVAGGVVLALAALVGLGAVLQTRAGSRHLWTFALPDLEY